MENTSKKTLLYQWHVTRGANMADFGGYEMPLWYSSSKNEHMAVLTNAGMFDTSHMAAVLISGSQAFELLQLCFTNDLSACIGINKKSLFPGRCVYGAFLNKNGEVIDDSIIYMVDENSYMAVVNAGMGTAIAQHLAANKAGKDAQIIDLTDNLGKMDIQGPFSAKILQKVLAYPQTVLNKMPYFSFKGHFDKTSPKAGEVSLKDGTPVMLSRTGYTGEFGFEIYVSPGNFVKTWETVFEAGQEFNIMACGLAARDSLRAGAVLPLSHQDIGPWPFINNPWPFALPYNNDRSGFTKTFLGHDALLNIQNPEYTYAFAGNDLRKVTLPASVFFEEKEIGTVLTCATDMALGRYEDKIYSIASTNKPDNLKIKGLCCGFIKVNAKLNPGREIELRDKRRKIKVRIEKDIRPERTARKPLIDML